LRTAPEIAPVFGVERIGQERIPDAVGVGEFQGS